MDSFPVRTARQQRPIYRNLLERIAREKTDPAAILRKERRLRVLGASKHSGFRIFEQPHGKMSFLVRAQREIRQARALGRFTPASRIELFKKLKPLEIDECPFANLPEKKAGRWGAGLTAAKMLECRWQENRDYRLAVTGLLGRFVFTPSSAALRSSCAAPVRSPFRRRDTARLW